MSEPMSEVQLHAARLGWIEGELRREGHRYAAQLEVSTSALLEHYEPLAALGQAVLDEHRSVLLAERDLTDPELQADAKANATYVRTLLQEMLTDGG